MFCVTFIFGMYILKKLNLNSTQLRYLNPKPKPKPMPNPNPTHNLNLNLNLNLKTSDHPSDCPSDNP